MRLPWMPSLRTREEMAEADLRVAQARGHLRVLLAELDRTLDRIEDKARRLAGDR